MDEAHHVIDPAGFEHVVLVTPDGVFGADNLAHTLEGSPRERGILIEQIVKALIAGGALPGDYRRTET
jgi:hypothetical protein